MPWVFCFPIKWGSRGTERHNKLPMATVLELILDLCYSRPQLSQLSSKRWGWLTWEICALVMWKTAKALCAVVGADAGFPNRINECRRGRPAGRLIQPVEVLSGVSYSDPQGLQAVEILFRIWQQEVCQSQRSAFHCCFFVFSVPFGAKFSQRFLSVFLASISPATCSVPGI